MSTSNARETGKAKLARLQAEQKRERQRKIMAAITAAVVVVVLVVVAGFYLVSRQQQKDNDAKAKANARDSAFISKVENVPAATFDTVGAGTASQAPKATNGSADTVDGKPRILYIGAEYCPYCGMERWALTSALSRFGTFKGVASAVSSPTDTVANIPTMTYLNASYTSQYIAFKSYETETRDEQPLQKVSAADAALQNKYDSQGSIPFLLYGGLYTSSGATYDGTALQNMSSAAVTQQMLSPTTAISKGILGASNVISAQICVLTKGAPANVCSSSGVKAASAKLAS
ncbi:DUF929 family protein [Allobranchiibius sp. GilTou73]|uniref:DUF929 family protein n=1 Tax=unclassified Allobranchiibius TaxID=2649857 RepID=UPI001AA0F383|nr:DUF929 family protein [Allobranchiibius sp. GilTou73]MBO1765280.1 DUF929 family protein [Allobranchiibius sp. GilTou38]UIJ34428.1 DUF929 domain-containing protein [Allobranchiibius sp. GilTou73]